MNLDEHQTLIEKSTEPKTVSDYAKSTLLQQYRDKFETLTRWDLYFECIGSCAFAASIYAISLYVLLFWGTYALFGLIIFWPFIVVIGLFLGAIAATIASLIFIPINALFDWPLSSLSQSFVIGGLAGFLSPALLMPLRMGDNFYAGVALGPFTAMTIGHVTAYWLTERTITQHNLRFGVQPFEAEVALFNRFHFRISQLFIFTAWVAIAFALLNMFPPEGILYWGQIYLVAQVASAITAILIIWSVAAIRRHRKKLPTTPNGATLPADR